MHKLTTSFILSYHGCDRKIGEDILSGNEFEFSENLYDWLGGGVYFWDANPKRAYQFAIEKQVREELENPFVIGAVVDLGLCLDLQTKAGIDKIQYSYNFLKAGYGLNEEPLPQNSEDMLRRELDCMVIDWLYRILEEDHQEDPSNEPPFDTVRGIFVEGTEAYPGAGIMTKTHTQVAVRNLNCIKGVFRVNEEEYLPD